MSRHGYQHGLGLFLSGLTKFAASVLLFGLQGLNPYGIGAGTELDGLIHKYCFGSEGELLPFSTDLKLAEKVKARVKILHGYPVVTGETRLKTRRYFARLDTGPSTSTEVLAETLPLAICRLALVVSLRHSNAV